MSDLADIIKRQGTLKLDEPIRLANGDMSSDFIDIKLALCRWADLRVATVVDQGDTVRRRFEALGVPYFPALTYADLDIAP